jgi:hypothetical protein
MPYLSRGATVTSAEINEQLGKSLIEGSSDLPVGRALHNVRRLLSHEPFLYNIVHQPKSDVEDWTVRVPAALRAYRDIESIDDYLDRLVEQVAPPPPPSGPPSPSPLDIPYAVGYLDAVWRSMTASHMFVNLDPASVARLTLACHGEEEFNSLMSALADVLGQVVRPGRSAPPQRGALEEFRDYLVPRLDADAGERVTSALEMLIRLRRIRVSTQHSDARHKAVTAFQELGMPFPPITWQAAWEHIAGLAAGALDAVREEIHAGLRRL